MSQQDGLYWKQAPPLIARYEIRGILELTSPMSLSNGDSEGITDILLRRDLLSRQPQLPGSTLAGALAGYLNAYLPHGAAMNRSLIERLFGENNPVASQQSWLFIEDSLGTERGVEFRDGVSIEDSLRVAADGKKYDTELLAAGSTFPLVFTFWEPANPGQGVQPGELRHLLGIALQALAEGHIPLGGRKRRGLGECQVTNWQVYRYDMAQPAGLLGWLEQDRDQPQK
ncbi:MAG: hypothetical protein KDE04_20530, partial [Anaerolineales bacterium]|nr:hypothetical protein [Anaerolineales bacterium]